MRFCNDGNHLVQINLLNFSDVPRRSGLFYGGNDVFYGEYQSGCKKILWRELHYLMVVIPRRLNCYLIVRAVLFRLRPRAVARNERVQSRLVLGVRSQA